MESLPRFLDGGRICLTNNAAEEAPRGVALDRKSWRFAGSARAGDRAAFMYSLIVTARMTAAQVPVLLPWNRRTSERRQAT